MIKKIITTIEKNTDLQNKICQRFAPSNDLTINPPKLKVQAPKKTKNGPGILFKKFILFDLICFLFQFHIIYKGFLPHLIQLI